MDALDDLHAHFRLRSRSTGHTFTVLALSFFLLWAALSPFYSFRLVNELARGVSQQYLRFRSIIILRILRSGLEILELRIGFLLSVFRVELVADIHVVGLWRAAQVLSIVIG